MEELDKEVKKLREDLQTLQKEKEKSDSGKVYSARLHTGTCITFTSHSGILQVGLGNNIHKSEVCHS